MECRVTADLYVEEDETVGADVEWTHDETLYRISAFRVSSDEDSVIRAARRALRDVRYATP